MTTPSSFAAPLLSALLLLAPGAAHAQEGSNEQPLAIPVGEEPPAPAALPREEGQLAIPHRSPTPMTPQRLALLRQYKDQRLVLRGETEVRSSATPVFGWGWGWGWGRPYGPVTTVGVAYAPVAMSRGWGIYQGAERLTVPDALSLTGDNRLTGLEEGIRRKKATATTWYSIAGVGAAAAVTSIFGRAYADTRNEYATWGTVGVAGGVSTIVGLVAGAGPAADARALRERPSLTMTHADARLMVDQYNDRLRQRLGLTPDEVWSVEQNDRP